MDYVDRPKSFFRLPKDGITTEQYVHLWCGSNYIAGYSLEKPMPKRKPTWKPTFAELLSSTKQSFEDADEAITAADLTEICREAAEMDVKVMDVLRVLKALAAVGFLECVTLYSKEHRATCRHYRMVKDWDVKRLAA